ncbi:MAG: PTS fructose transporter subunit IIB [Clostridiales Family XIII bacterium]|nr:PTS fructose transporter subunit IIB [Clostridiales Family XIII bacterium]
MKDVKLLCVCGSGAVSSSMVAMKLKDALREHGYNATTVETSPNSVAGMVESTHFDLIACVSPVPGDFSVPKIDAVGMLTGLGEDQVIEDCLKALGS